MIQVDLCNILELDDVCSVRYERTVLGNRGHPLESCVKASHLLALEGCALLEVVEVVPQFLTKLEARHHPCDVGILAVLLVQQICALQGHSVFCPEDVVV